MSSSHCPPWPERPQSLLLVDKKWVVTVILTQRWSCLLLLFYYLKKKAVDCQFIGVIIWRSPYGQLPKVSMLTNLWSLICIISGGGLCKTLEADITWWRRLIIDKIPWICPGTSVFFIFTCSNQRCASYRALNPDRRPLLNQDLFKNSVRWASPPIFAWMPL